MDLSLPIIGLIAVSGYVLNDKKNPRSEKFQRKKISPHETPSGKSIYTSNLSKEIADKEQEIANLQFAKSRYPKKSNIIPPIYNSDCTWGCEKTASEVAVMSNSKIVQEIIPKKKKDIFKGPMFEERILAQGNDNFKENFENGISSLTGMKLDMNHENMVPHFGGNVRQNTDLVKGNQSILDNYTGISFDFKPPKREVENLGKIGERQVFGSQFKIDTSRFIASNYQQGAKPLPEIKVQPLPPTFVRPKFKNVDNLRVKSKPKTEFLQPLTSGKRTVTERGVATPLSKNRPKKYFEFNQDRYLTSVGEVKGDIVRIASEGSGLVTLQKESTKHENLSDWIRNASSQNSIFSQEKESFIIRDTERQTSSVQIQGQAKNIISGPRQVLSDKPRITNKEMNLYEYSGNTKNEVEGQQDYSSFYNQTKQRQDNPENEYVTPGSRTTTGNVIKGISKVRTVRENVADNSNYTYNGVLDSEMTYVGVDSIEKTTKDKSFEFTRNAAGQVTGISSVQQFGSSRKTNDKYNFADRNTDPNLVKVLKNNPIAQEFKF